MSERTERAGSFGRVAELYDRWRPGYPAALYDDVLGLSPGGRVLEAGAGTGRATVGLAGRGVSVTAVEPDAAMASVARQRSAGMPVRVLESTFEDARPEEGGFDLVVSAQAWHWIDWERGAAVAARALRSGGSLCLWWNRPDRLDGPVWDAIHGVYAEHAPSLDRRAELDQQADREASFEPAPGFVPWSLRSYLWTAVYDAESYLGLLGTHSDHLALPAAQLARLSEAVAITTVGGGSLEYAYRTVLAHARVR